MGDKYVLSILVAREKADKSLKVVNNVIYVLLPLLNRSLYAGKM